MLLSTGPDWEQRRKKKNPIVFAKSNFQLKISHLKGLLRLFFIYYHFIKMLGVFNQNNPSPFVRMI